MATPNQELTSAPTVAIRPGGQFSIAGFNRRQLGNEVHIYHVWQQVSHDLGIVLNELATTDGGTDTKKSRKLPDLVQFGVLCLDTGIIEEKGDGIYQSDSKEEQVKRLRGLEERFVNIKSRAIGENGFDGVVTSVRVSDEGDDSVIPVQVQVQKIQVHRPTDNDLPGEETIEIPVNPDPGADGDQEDQFDALEEVSGVVEDFAKQEEIMRTITGLSKNGAGHKSIVVPESISRADFLQDFLDQGELGRQIDSRFVSETGGFLGIVPKRGKETTTLAHIPGDGFTTILDRMIDNEKSYYLPVGAFREASERGIVGSFSTLPSGDRRDQLVREGVAHFEATREEIIKLVRSGGGGVHGSPAAGPAMSNRKAMNDFLNPAPDTLPPPTAEPILDPRPGG